MPIGHFSVDAFSLPNPAEHRLILVIFVVEVDIPWDLTVPTTDQGVAVINDLNALRKVAELLMVPDGDIIAGADEDALSEGLSFSVDFSLVVALFFNLTIGPGSEAAF